MRYEVKELQDGLNSVLNGRSPDEYVREGCAKIWRLCGQSPDYWKHFGPYYGLVKQLLEKYHPEFEQLREWAPPPGYLVKYSYGNEALNLFAALRYLGRDGDWLPGTESAHSIETPAGERLFIPGVGLVEHD